MMIVFYEKNGCKTNAQQKTLLLRAGYELDVKDLRSRKWLQADIHCYLKDLPVSQWFNRTAPRVKSGEIDPDHLSPNEALDLMVADPLLIRRPLIETSLGCGCGFEPALLQKLGIHKVLLQDKLEGCSNATPHDCPDPFGK